MALPCPQLIVLETAVVAPLPAGVLETSLPLTFLDIIWLNSPPVERLFFYRLSPCNRGHVLSNLKTSLSQALHAFYPLAGRLRLTPGTTDRYELHYCPGDGVAFTVTEYDVDVDELVVDGPREVAKILPLATVLRGGLAVGMVLHHAACDGASSTRFLHTWAEAAAGTAAMQLQPTPVVNRSLIKDPSGFYDVCMRAATASTGEWEFAKMSDDKLLATFTLSKQDIQRIKEVVLVAAGEAREPPPRCTSLVATLGFIWSCYQRAKDDDEAIRGGNTTYIAIPVNHRSRMKPDPIPNEYFGNCIGPAMQGAPKAQLLAAGASGLLVACTAVAAAIEEAVSSGTRSPELWGENIREAVMSGGGLLSTAGSPRFRVYDVDFGFGRPAKVEIVSVARTGAMAVAESRGRNAGDGLEVGISLRPDGMRRFQKCFDDAVAWLHHHEIS
ncbi:hypothetical protein VPH35_107535 [Triticum aestivum]